MLDDVGKRNLSRPILMKRDVAVVASCEHTVLSGFRNESSLKIPLYSTILSILHSGKK